MCRTMATHKRILSTLSTLRNGPTRRNLFGPVDREQLQVEYQASIRKDLEEASQRWGFDFISDKPLESSDFQWEGVPGTKVPLLYRSCMFDQEQVESQRAADVKVSPKGRKVAPPHNEKENIPLSPRRCSLKLENVEKTPQKTGNTALKRKQTNLTDFYQAKRRVVGMPRKSGE
ncbi:cyclin-dependent kinase inhibitor 1 isoform X1 [Scomber japonicus]|uniref:cyclin-dependent kinase inhibitor 1 isoform X1 n=2 Tax=Scomber japonicus TaxID=13676 RepID=UPI002306585E|nr:cyclin-dependent kinase inhibitor 1 isoform X1 [Scomber japonicus]